MRVRQLNVSHLVLCSAAVSLFSGCGGASAGSSTVLPGSSPTPIVSGTSNPSGSGTGLIPTDGAIKHVVIIVQENRTPDNLFNGLPGADTVRTAKTHDGKTMQLIPSTVGAANDPCHFHDCWVTDYDGGKMDGFDVAR